MKILWGFVFILAVLLLQTSETVVVVSAWAPLPSTTTTTPPRVSRSLSPRGLFQPVGFQPRTPHDRCLYKNNMSIPATNDDGVDNNQITPFDPLGFFSLQQDDDDDDSTSQSTMINDQDGLWTMAPGGIPVLAATTLAVVLVGTPTLASAATAASNGNVIVSALAAYGHFVSLMIMSACIMAERVILKPNMSDQEEVIVAIADTVLGVAGVLVAYTGYIRVKDYGNGWDFYSHEPMFWFKITLVGVFGAASFFNTVQIVQRSIAKRNNGGITVEPMTEALAARMIQICNAELLALASIPLTATLMARGVSYTNAIPWQVGAGISVLVFGGLSYKYIQEALTWTEEEEVVGGVEGK